MESGPAVFAGVVFTVFGAVLLMWTGTRAWRGRPVAEGVRQVTAAALTGGFGLVSGCGGVWMLLSG
ncbi:hypothetical protein DVA86_14270 [Streptomyces armeniacus]|uniref:Uncharacterized protein n=1 Tax=Streptomyces armeniacus TaxID=83291 RepID=A0A345Y0B3_9ACTN|nr:hypothetical protein [Streptomyces armeniacus]AXK37329.1 hypothetical protein DVA86_14270 [Streptomyces armeniacus]